MSNKKERFEYRYQTGATPWDSDAPDSNLVELLENGQISPCKAVEPGCGTGSNCVWLAGRGFTVTGVDLSPTAIEKARGRAVEAAVDCSFLIADFMETEMPGAPFSFFFDRGCFHGFDTEENRRRFAARAAELLDDTGLWFSIIGNYDEHRVGEIGPPRRSATEIVRAVEPYFEILSLASGRFGSGAKNAARAWVCLFRKRPVHA